MEPRRQRRIDKRVDDAWGGHVPLAVKAVVALLVFFVALPFVVLAGEAIGMVVGMLLEALR